jgi:hypothetical protein
MVCDAVVDARFQSTPPSREATAGMFGWLSRIGVSIHAPLTGGDRNILWLKIAPTLDVVLYLPLIGIQFNMRYSLRSHM